MAGAAALAASGVAAASSVAVTSRSLGASAIPVTITTVTISPSVADTYASQAQPNSSFGTATTMNVQSRSGANMRSFVRFDLSTIPSNARVQLATLQLTMSVAPSASRVYEADRITQSWSEASLTWSTMPPAASATATTSTGTTSGVVLSWAVTTDVASFVTGSATNYGWQITDTAESSASTRTGTFRTREYGTAAARPKLVVTYAT